MIKVNNGLLLYYTLLITTRALTNPDLRKKNKEMIDLI